MTIFNVFTLMGGIAMFLYGMDLMGKALEQTAGSKLQGILSTMTSSPIRALLLGVAVTAVIQSSGATTVMAVGFVNSGLMELHQAIGVIMGANIGTTVTGWLLSLSGLEGESFITKMLNPNAWSPILGFIGIWLYMVGKDRKRGVGKILLGFAILMAGMNTMSNAMSPLADEPWFMNLFLSFSNPVLGVIAGAVLTAVLQSSSAAVGILQALTSTGAVTYSAAVPIIMGQNIEPGNLIPLPAFASFWNLSHRYSSDLLGRCEQKRQAHCLRPSLFQRHRHHYLPVRLLRPACADLFQLL